MQKKLHYFYVFVAGALWGIISLFLKPLLDMGFSQMQTVTLRCLLAAAVLGIYMLLKDKSLFRFHLRDIWCFLGTGLLSLLFFSVCYFYSMTYNGVCVAVILLYTSPVFVMLLSLLLFKDKITYKKLIAVALTIIGCVLVSGVAGGQSIGAVGIVLGICSGLGYALYSIFSRYALQKNYHSMTISFYTFLFCGLGCLPFAKPVAMVASLTPKAILLVVGLGVVCCVLPYLFYTKGLESVDNTRASVIVAVEPVVASLIGIFVYHESVTALKIAGVVLVLAAVLICSTASAAPQNADEKGA